MSSLVLEVAEEAEGELYKVVDYYVQFDKELAYDFIEDFDQTVKRLKVFPMPGHPICSIQDELSCKDFPLPLFIKFMEAS